MRTSAQVSIKCSPSPALGDARTSNLTVSQTGTSLRPLDYYAHVSFRDAKVRQREGKLSVRIIMSSVCRGVQNRVPFFIAKHLDY